MFFVRSASEADLPKVQALLGRIWRSWRELNPRREVRWT